MVWIFIAITPWTLTIKQYGDELFKYGSGPEGSSGISMRCPTMGRTRTCSPKQTISGLKKPKYCFWDCFKIGINFQGLGQIQENLTYSAPQLSCFAWILAFLNLNLNLCGHMWASIEMKIENHPLFKHSHSWKIMLLFFFIKFFNFKDHIS